jgi:regulator of replication initiation timing
MKRLEITLLVINVTISILMIGGILLALKGQREIRAEMNFLENKIATLEAKIGTISTLEQEVDALRKEVSNLVEKISTLNRVVATQEELKEVRERLKQLEEEDAVLKKEIEGLKGSVQQKPSKEIPPKEKAKETPPREKIRMESLSLYLITGETPPPGFYPDFTTEVQHRVAKVGVLGGSSLKEGVGKYLQEIENTDAVIFVICPTSFKEYKILEETYPQLSPFPSSELQAFLVNTPLFYFTRRDNKIRGLIFTEKVETRWGEWLLEKELPLNSLFRFNERGEIVALQ